MPYATPAAVVTANAVTNYFSVLRLIQLEQVEGSGLFLVACILEHACNPNCRFVSEKKKCWVNYHVLSSRLL